MIEIIPAIDIIGGKCVRLSQGDYQRCREYEDSPLEMAKRFEDCGARWLHTVDLEGARGDSPKNLKTIEQIATRTSLKIEMGGGIYDMPAGFSYIHPKDNLHKASSHGAILSCNCLKIKGGGNFVAL